jgi:hemolysin III
MPADSMALSVAPEQRPALRGVLHGIAFALAIAGTVLLMLLANKPTGYVGGAIFATSLMLLYSTSATYHQVRFWRRGWARVFKRVDHSMIFVLIAGTYTPFCLDVSLAWGIPMLAVVWTLAGLGALTKIVWPDAPRWLGVGLYVALGWIALVAAAEVVDRYLGSPLALLLAGGALYTVGGIVYGLKRPDPWPRVFGYHEIFHSFVVAGSAVHYAAVAIYVVR